MTRYYMDGGEPPPTGIMVMVDALNKEAEAAGRSLEAAMKLAEVEDVKFTEDKNAIDPALAPYGVFIQIGRRANQ